MASSIPIWGNGDSDSNRPVRRLIRSGGQSTVLDTAGEVQGRPDRAAENSVRGMSSNPAGGSPGERAAQNPGTPQVSARRASNLDVRTAGPVVYSLQVQLIFTLKHRRGVFTQELLARCEQVMGSTCTEYGAELREFHGATDHVRLLVDYPPRVPISRLVEKLKAASARQLRLEFPDHNLWSPSYFAATCGAPQGITMDYIDHLRR
ncbi:hypothetical protein E3G44_000385 [Mycobacteroides abscessus]|uniref:IS200/IS605 family transposase n=2 Tax=Mycobacteroides abscessus TaxID=36809 RepID=UPI000929BB7C|nr:hypothetical protein [Mycobacteroides abscessus]SHO95064.1 transposase IS200-family protein [Mycobacteroides abscessus subsp. abscessus]SHP89091.1 transposase IS200-family protein [Mycobacteroides abscessus subsp. abscessus]SHP92314.1 transposase IS200-family protein [Mycobacteroides abscessus subsp. abscessus]SHQ16990.1 transposase IS200-family protein [Mycobacteroides abscessus subsp. abscessus]